MRKRVRRTIHIVNGEAEAVASLMAARLAYLGDQVEAVSANEFVWRPQAAERLILSAPTQARVTVLPRDEAGQCSVVIEVPAGASKSKLFGAAGLVGLIGASLGLMGGGLPALLGALLPALALAVVPLTLDSGWAARLRKSAEVEPSQVFDRVPEAARFLELSADEQQEVVGRLVAAGRELARSDPLLGYSGSERRSDETLLGWPVWTVAAGRDPVTGQSRTARGWYARGQISQGLVAIGQKSQGWVAIGQLAMGLIAVGQLAIGLFFSLGQAALAGLVGLGQLGVGLVAAGQFAVGLLVAMVGNVDQVAKLVALGALVTLAPAALVGSLVLRGWLSGQSQREAEEALRDYRATRPATPDETAISPAQRLTGSESIDRGLSSADAE